MKHHRWIGAQWPVSIREIAKRMREHLFVDGASEGFLIDSTRTNLIEGRFIQHSRFEESFIDPFGREERNEIVSYNQLNFILNADFPQIEMINPPRSQQRFLTLLSDFSDFSVRISSIDTNVINWFCRFQQEYDEEYFMDQIYVNQFSLDEGTLAKLIATGKGDVQNSVSKILRNRDYKIDKARIKSLSRPSDYIIITSTGSAKIRCIRQEAVKTALKNTILNNK